MAGATTAQATRAFCWMIRLRKKCLAGPRGGVMNIPQENNAKTVNTWKNFWDKEYWRNFWEKARKYISLALFIIVGFVFAKCFTMDCSSCS